MRLEVESIIVFIADIGTRERVAIKLDYIAVVRKVDTALFEAYFVTLESGPR